jgi:hypothetical protein
MNKSYEATLLITLIALLIGAVLSYVSVEIYQKNDAPLEQLAEVIVKDITGISIDFTPSDKPKS